MKTCPRCHKEYGQEASQCPHCALKPKKSGVFQTSTVLISAEGTERVYRSVDEVPAPLRSRLLKTTSSSNADTILIADRKGREEIDKAIRKMPSSAPRRQFGAILSGREQSAPPGWLTPVRRKAIAAVVMLLALAIVALMFLRAWK